MRHPYETHAATWPSKNHPFVQASMSSLACRSSKFEQTASDLHAGSLISAVLSPIRLEHLLGMIEALRDNRKT
ncbi:uncharacterized protein K441DRAFT_651848 [Cenococcum geophilum 1.58]|uniref:uncharacterized protein n=1 Tax=Cenococcum geophilum 1.58 TaxID=794803 RepID=UPI00358F001A|nr:hypothetical protein K441DRAFT_651848 [Cenococcum geophilum 1.58]